MEFVFEIAGRLHEINNLRQELFYINIFDIFSAPPSRVEINNLSATKSPAPLDIEWWPP